MPAGLVTNVPLIMLAEEHLRNSLDGCQTDLVLLEFSKAFDKVRKPPEGHAKVAPVHMVSETSGSTVHQRSILGSIPFLLYINDIRSMTRSQLKLCIDDTAIFTAVCSLRDAQLLQENLNQLQEWE